MNQSSGVEELILCFSPQRRKRRRRRVGTGRAQGKGRRHWIDIDRRMNRVHQWMMSVPIALLFYAGLSSAYAPGDFVHFSRRGQYHVVSSVSLPLSLCLSLSITFAYPLPPLSPSLRFASLPFRSSMLISGVLLLDQIIQLTVILCRFSSSTALRIDSDVA